MARLDFIIFGATGFTGKLAVKEMCHVSKKYPGMTWGVAGRSEKKLDEMLKEISKKVGEDLSSIRKIVADAEEEKPLLEMCSQCKVLVNCCGLYQRHGEPVVKASIESKTHYVDVAAEPQFMKKTQLDYDEIARDAGVYIITACGFGSIPNDLGVIYLQQNFGGTLNSVESYLTTFTPDYMNGIVNYGTWESVVHGVANFRELPRLRKKLFPEDLPDLRPKLKSRAIIHKQGSRWCVPYLSADESVMYRTQRRLHARAHTRPIQIKTYVRFPSLLATLGVGACAVLLFLCSLLPCTRRLLLRFPRFFSAGAISREPTEAALSNTKYTFEFYGRGWAEGTPEDRPPNRTMTAKVSGADGYRATAVALLLSAITILQQEDRLPECGVLTSGYAFRNTDIVRRLSENGIKFEIVDSNDKK